jgi:hypothetical protein
MTATNQALRDQIEALKLQKELATLQAEVAPAPVALAAPQQEVCQPKAPHVAAAAAPRVNVDNGICERQDYAPGFHANRSEINLARTRCYGIVAWHVVCAPIASVAYAAKTGKWGATVAATGVAAIGVPLAFADAGLTLTIAAPVTSIILSVKQVQDGRKRLGITMPEQADAMKFSSF